MPALSPPLPARVSLSFVLLIPAAASVTSQLNAESHNSSHSIDRVCRGPDAYLADPWYRIDAFVVLVAVASLALPELTLLRALRAMRPLRVIARVPRIKVKALPPLLPPLLPFMNGIQALTCAAAPVASLLPLLANTLSTH